MKLTKNTNKVRIESPGFYQPEIFEKGSDGVWAMTQGSLEGVRYKQDEFQVRLYKDDKMGYQIFDISEDEDEQISE